MGIGKEGKNMQSTQIDLLQHFSEYKENGYTIFEKVYNQDQIQAWIKKFRQLQEESFESEKAPMAFPNMIELAPKLMLPNKANPLILDFAEMVMGPFVQINDSVIFGSNSVSKEEAKNKVNGWHRDRFAMVPKGDSYQRPSTMNQLCYLQDLTEEHGPLRVIPGSHRKGITMKDEERLVPHADELLIQVKAGDVVVFHNALLHTGSPNTSPGGVRLIIGGSYNSTWMRHTDNHSGPNVQRLIQQARERNDHRMLRLFGVDDQWEARMNSGFTVPDEIRWAEWAAADKAAVKTNH